LARSKIVDEVAVFTQYLSAKSQTVREALRSGSLTSKQSYNVLSNVSKLIQSSLLLLFLKFFHQTLSAVTFKLLQNFN